MIIAIGSKNPVKIQAVKIAFDKYFKDIQIVSCQTDSLVSAQPKNEETYIGAKNRAISAIELINNADYGVGIESGIHKYFDRWFGNTVVCITNKNYKLHFGLSTAYEIWEELKDNMLLGEEMGSVLSQITGIENINQKNGTIGFLSDGHLNRTDETVRACIMALIPFIKDEFYK